MSKRFLQIVGLIAFGVAISGVARALHVTVEHAPGTPGASHTCHTDAPEDHAPTRPTPSEDEECDLCLTISSGERSVGAPPESVDVAVPDACVGAILPRGVAVVTPHARRAGPARAPPVCA